MTRRNIIYWSGALLAGLIVLISGAASRHRHTNQAEPELELKKDFDLGLVLDTTSPMQLAIPITNRANRVITIQDIAKDCSCTSVKIDKRKLAPGETAILRVVTNLSGKTDLYESNLIVESDAVERVDQIRIRGTITGQIRIRPERVTVLTGDLRTPGSFSVFCDDQNGKWRYTGFVSDDPNLVVQLRKRETSPTTSVFDGMIDIESDTKRKQYVAFQTSTVTLSFINDQIGRHYDLKYGVDIAVRRDVTVDPPQVMFLENGTEQQRTFLVQSSQSLNIDAVKCTSPSIKVSLRRIDAMSLKVDLVFHPTSGAGVVVGNQVCELLSEGKPLKSVPVNIVGIH